jgi:endonuclease YncB( thermonuclease family)
MQSGAGASEGLLVLVVLALVLFVVVRVALRSHRDHPQDTSRPSPPPAAWSPPRVPLPPSAPPPRPLPQAEAPPSPTSPHVPAPFTAKAHVVDGDSICFDRGRVRVRLFGIDAPEMSQFGGKAARGHLIRMIGGQRVTIRPVDIDHYGRIVARVQCAGSDVCLAMVRDGYAVAMVAFSREYVAVEMDARRARRGLWKASAEWGIQCPSRHRRTERWKAGEAGR